MPFSGINNAGGGSTTISGSFTGSDVIAMPSATPPINNLDDLIAQMKAGNTYANLHTAANPGGEIRGQISQQ